MEKELTEFEASRISDGYLYATDPKTKFEFRINSDSVIKLRTHIGAGIVTNVLYIKLEDLIKEEAVFVGYIQNDEIILVPYKNKP